MPRNGGEADKLGNHFEAVWTVEAALDVLEGQFRSITVEAFGEESIGVEFHLESNDGVLQFHSVKRQKQGGDWSISDLCEGHATRGRSILGDLFAKRLQRADAEVRFISATGANELRELEERAKKPTTVSEFKGILSVELRGKFDTRIVPLFAGDSAAAFAALKSLEVILRSHKDLIRSVEQRIDGLFNRVDGSQLRADDVRRMIAEFILENLGPEIDRDRLRSFLHEKGIGVQDWKLDATVNDAVANANRRYLSSAETELINRAHIVRDVVVRITETLADPVSRGALLIAPGGFGKSCVVAQCVAQLSMSGTPYLCLRMDSFTPCNTARQLGEQMDLRTSPAVVLAGIANNAPSVLVVDQLDAMSLVSGRNPQMWEVFRELCDEVRRYPRMKMILACRDFDLEHDHRLRGLGDSESGFVKFRLNRLSDGEVQASLLSAELGKLQLSPPQLEILGIPFHLLLFLQGDPTGGFNTAGELYDQYWNRKRQKLRRTLGRESRWNEVIDALTTRMSEQQLLFAPVSVTDDWEIDAQAMASEHVLIEVQNQRQYRFFHESFFDYAYARRFCSTGRNVISLLESSEQHLFRRAQVRQILAYRRESEFHQYLADIREILESPKIRFHIKRMVASGFNRIVQPKQEEWEILEPHLLEGELSRYVSSAMRDHVGWFDLLNSYRVFEMWLASDELRLRNTAIWYLESHGLHDIRSAEIAKLISQYSKRDDWQQQIQRIMSWGQAHKSAEMTAIYLGLIADGAYDDFESNVRGGDFWSQHYNAEKETPRFVIDVLATWFDRVVRKYDDGEKLNILDMCQLNHSHAGAQMIGKAAADEPQYFVERMLPQLIAAVLKTETSDNEKFGNRVWPWLSNSGDPFDISGAILISVRKSLQFLASQNVDEFRRHATTIQTYPHLIFAYLLLLAWAENPKEYADECAMYMTTDPRRLHVGYDIRFGGGEGRPESAISRIALRAISSFCTPNLLVNLESQIIGYAKKGEKQVPRWRGYSELLVLRSLDRSRISKKAELRIEELERKFPSLTDSIANVEESCLMGIVSPPIPQTAVEKMNDDQWISAMMKYDGSTERFRGGPVELSRLLCECARKDRNRFAALAAKMPGSVDPMYFSAILDGLSGRFTSLVEDEKEADQNAVNATSTDVFVGAIERLHELPGRQCGSAIVTCIRRLSSRTLHSRVLEIASYYAINDPDPMTDIWQDTECGKSNYRGDPHHHGINCVRGQAAEALSTLLFDDYSRFEVLRPALVALAADPIISVRTCAINAFLPLLIFAPDFAVELFLKACDRCEAICATSPFDRFIYYAIYTRYAQVRELLQFALNSGIPKAVEHAARRITLAELQNIPVASDAANILSGNEIMRKAAVNVFAADLSNDVVGDKCAARLEAFFNDESESVRKEVCRAFFNVRGERLLQLKHFIAHFIESHCFESEPDRLLHALEESNVELPQIICRAAERILEFLSDEGTHVANPKAMVARDISALVVRQYEQTTDPTVKKRCLDLIDQMERIGFFGIGEELAKIDR